MTLTSEHLLLSFDGEGQIRDKIKLTEVTSINAHRYDDDSRPRPPLLKQGSVVQMKLDKLKSEMQTKEPLGFTFGQLDMHAVLTIHMKKFGRTYYLKAQDIEDCESWVNDIQTAIENANERLERSLNLTRLDRCKITVGRFYESYAFQLFVAATLLTNYAVNIYEAEIQPTSDSGQRVFDQIDTAFSALYAIELSMNMFVHWGFSFWMSGWNVFDFIITMVSLVETVFTLPLNPTLIRIFRIFRLARLLR